MMQVLDKDLDGLNKLTKILKQNIVISSYGGGVKIITYKAEYNFTLEDLDKAHTIIHLLKNSIGED